MFLIFFIKNMFFILGVNVFYIYGIFLVYKRSILCHWVVQNSMYVLDFMNGVYVVCMFQVLKAECIIWVMQKTIYGLHWTWRGPIKISGMNEWISAHEKFFWLWNEEDDWKPRLLKSSLVLTRWSQRNWSTDDSTNFILSKASINSSVTTWRMLVRLRSRHKNVQTGSHHGNPLPRLLRIDFGAVMCPTHLDLANGSSLTGQGHVLTFSHCRWGWFRDKEWWCMICIPREKSQNIYNMYNYINIYNIYQQFSTGGTRTMGGTPDVAKWYAKK